MTIVDYFESDNQPELKAKIGECEWRAAKFLVELLDKGTFNDMLGGWGHIFLLMDGERLVSFLTLSGQDAIRDEALTPWVGFVFTSPEYRGQRHAGRLITHAEHVAAEKGYRKLYICTDHVGLYEKYGFIYLENRIDYWGDNTQMFCKGLEEAK